LLAENYAHYQRPIFVAETGIEDETRPAWMRYICNEVYAAIAAGVPIEGVCLYPILNHPAGMTTDIAITVCSIMPTMTEVVRSTFLSLAN
jgi:hypothetical protein